MVDILVCVDGATPLRFCRMAGQFDERWREILHRVFSGPSGVPDFSQTAKTGGHRKDEGLLHLLPRESPTDADHLYECIWRLKDAIARLLATGGCPTVGRAPGDTAMGLDSAVFFHFRVRVMSVRLFVKIVLDEHAGREPVVRVISVKRDDNAWSE